MLDGHLQPLCTIAAEGSLSSDSFRAGRMAAAAELGQQETFPAPFQGAGTCCNVQS